MTVECILAYYIYMEYNWDHVLGTEVQETGYTKWLSIRPEWVEMYISKMSKDFPWGAQVWSHRQRTCAGLWRWGRVRLLGKEWREGKNWVFKKEEYLLKPTDTKILKNLTTHSPSTKSREYKWEHYPREKECLADPREFWLAVNSILLLSSAQTSQLSNNLRRLRQ